MKTIFIHVGPAKTGTSAIQHFYETSAEAPFYYPKVGLWPDGSHHNLVFSVTGDQSRPEADLQPTETLLCELRRRIEGSDQDALISSEALTQRNIEKFVDAMKDTFQGSSVKFKFVVVCREHFERSSSLYNQRVKDPVTCETRDPDEFLRRGAKSICYEPLITWLMKTGLDVIVLNYHGQGELVERFSRALGAEIMQLPPLTPRNISVGHKGLVALLAANRTVGRSDERRIYFDHLRKMRKFFSQSRFIFNSEVAQFADIIFDDDRMFLKEKFGIELPKLDLAIQRNEFCLSNDDFMEIVSLVDGVGSRSEDLLNQVRKYVAA